MTGQTRSSIEFEVPFHDVDGLNVVWHGHYLKYLEIARTKLFRDLGFEPEPGARRAGTDENEHSLRIVESHCRHLFPLYYGDRVKVTAWIKDAEPTIRVAYEVYNISKDKKSARARTTIVVLDREGELVTKLSKSSIERLLA